MPMEFLQRSHAGAGIQVLIYDSTGAKIVGRANQFDFNDPIEILPVDELGVNGINELVPARMPAGNGTVSFPFIAGINDALPYRDNFLNMGPFSVQIVIAEGYPQAGTIMEQFENVFFTMVGASFSPVGLAAHRASVVYTKRTPGEMIQGVDYPAS